MNKQAIFDKFIEFMGTFAQLRVVAALRDGFIATTPFTICGSVFLLLANLSSVRTGRPRSTRWPAARSACWHSSWC